MFDSFKKFYVLSEKIFRLSRLTFGSAGWWRCYLQLAIMNLAYKSRHFPLEIKDAVYEDNVHATYMLYTTYFALFSLKCLFLLNASCTTMRLSPEIKVYDYNFVNYFLPNFLKISILILILFHSCNIYYCSMWNNFMWNVFPSWCHLQNNWDL